MRHAILGAIMLLCALLTTLFTASALEKFGHSHADLYDRPAVVAGSPPR